MRAPGDENEEGDEEVDPRPPIRPVRSFLWGILVIAVSMAFYCLEIWLRE